MTVKFQDYYQPLGVSRDATQEEVKKAYRRLDMNLLPLATTSISSCQNRNVLLFGNIL